MTYGLRVVNTTLKTQIDSTYQMFGMAVKSTGVGNTITGIDYYNDQIMICTPSLGDGQQRYTFSQGVRFTNNRLDTITGQNRTGAFYENLSTLGSQNTTPNFSTIYTARDYAI
jgi:hypothetical protein